MKMKSYCRPESLGALYEALSCEDGKILFVAGATDVLVQGRDSDRFADHAAIDLTNIPELREIRDCGTHLCIGSGVTHAALAASPLVCGSAAVLAQAAGQVGACQLRNRATLGGNIANASPAGDTLGPLAALNARVVLDLLGSAREVPVTEFITAPSKTLLREREFIRGVIVPKTPAGALSRFYKVGRRNALSISRLTLSVVCDVDAAGNIRELRLGVGAVFPHPMRFFELEKRFVGSPLCGETAATVAAALAEKIPEIAGRRASTDYKMPVCRLACERLIWEMSEEYGKRDHLL